MLETIVAARRLSPWQLSFNLVNGHYQAEMRAQRLRGVDLGGMDCRESR